MNNLQKLTDIIHKLVPSTLELSFGCEVEYYDLVQVEVDDFRDGIATVIGEKGQIPVMGYLANKTMYETEYRTFPYSEENGNGSKKILGHPIQLHHVLEAIKSKDKDLERELAEKGHPNTKSNYLGSFLMTWRAMDSQVGIGDKPFWDLPKPLNEQSEECIDFLLDLLTQTNK